MMMLVMLSLVVDDLGLVEFLLHVDVDLLCYSMFVCDDFRVYFALLFLLLLLVYVM